MGNYYCDYYFAVCCHGVRYTPCLCIVNGWEPNVAWLYHYLSMTYEQSSTAQKLTLAILTILINPLPAPHPSTFRFAWRTPSFVTPAASYYYFRDTQPETLLNSSCNVDANRKLSGKKHANKFILCWAKFIFYLIESGPPPLLLLPISTAYILNMHI